MTTEKNIQGAFTAIVTPMRDGKVDEQGLTDLINFQFDNGIHGLVPCGTTGESATLNFNISAYSFQKGISANLS